MKKHLLVLLASSLLLGVFSVSAQTGALVTCDGSSTSPCTWVQFFEIMRNIISLGLGISILYAFSRIAYIGAKYGLRSDEAAVRTEFRNNSIVILLSAIAIVALLPFTSYVLKTLKADAKVTNPIDCLQKADSPGCPGANKQDSGLKVNLQFFPHAHAQTQNILPQTVKMNGSIYDYAFLMFQLVIRILFIALIILWVYAGFSLVAARGNPTEIEKGKNRLWYSVFLTVILLLVQVLLVALKGTITS